MPIDLNRIDEATLALLYLGLHDDKRAWKSFDWDATDRQNTKKQNTKPHNKTKSVVKTKKKQTAARAAFTRLFGE